MAFDVTTFIVRSLSSPVLLLTVFLPLIFTFIRENLRARGYVLIKNREKPPDWLKYLLNTYMENYSNFILGLYSLCGGWIALFFSLRNLEEKISIPDVVLANTLPFSINNIITGFNFAIIFIGITFVFLVLVMRVFSSYSVIRSFFTHDPKRELRWLPPANRILWIRILLAVLGLAVVAGEVYWLPTP